MKYKVGDKVSYFNEVYKVVQVEKNGIDIAGNHMLLFIKDTEFDFLKPLTNRQWLESLSDEEFAEFLTSDNWVCKDIDADLCWFSGSNISCRQCKKQWLQAEHVEREY